MPTPARTMAPAPVLGPHAKPTRVVVKTTHVKMEPGMNQMPVLPPPCSSFTPVKSPDQKRSKASVPAAAPSAVPLRRSLCAEMDASTAAAPVGHGVDVPMGGGSDDRNLNEASSGKDVLQLNSFLGD